MSDKADLNICVLIENRGTHDRLQIDGPVSLVGALRELLGKEGPPEPDELGERTLVTVKLAPRKELSGFLTRGELQWLVRRLVDSVDT